jgi:hypothetical protein
MDTIEDIRVPPWGYTGICYNETDPIPVVLGHRAHEYGQYSAGLEPNG